MPRRDEDHSGKPRRCRTRGQTPGHPGEPNADGTVLLDFSATATTDQGRVRSFDHPHFDADRWQLAGRSDQLGNWDLPPEGGGPQLMNNIEHTIDKSVILK